jgi:hypothetical protein
MADLDIISSLATGGGLGTAAIITHFLRQLSGSFKEMAKSISALNTTMTKVVTDQSHYENDIGRLRDDVKELQIAIRSKQ